MIMYDGNAHLKMLTAK